MTKTTDASKTGAKTEDQGDFAVAFWKLRVTEQDRKKVTEIWEIICMQ